MILADEKGIPGRIAYFLKGKVDLKFDNLGITRKSTKWIKWDVCTVCSKEIKMNLRNPCFSSALATPQALSREIEQIKQVMAFAETTPGPWARHRAGRWMIVLQSSLTQNSCSNVEGMALQPRLGIQL